jgi:GntR family transcriptional regulator
LHFDSSRPIYKQIIDAYKKQLIRGELQQGDKIPSQREFAERARVNPNTVQRAYREMENMHMVETLRGQGTFIKAGDEMLSRIREEMAQNLLDYFIREMTSLGYTGLQVDELIKKRLGMETEDSND